MELTKEQKELQIKFQEDNHDSLMQINKIVANYKKGMKKNPIIKHANVLGLNKLFDEIEEIPEKLEKWVLENCQLKNEK